MEKNKLTYQELENQIAELKKQNKAFRLHPAFRNWKDNRDTDLLFTIGGENECEQYYNTILNNMGDPVFIKDEQSRLILVNNAFCEIFDRNRLEILGKTLAEDVDPEEQEVFLKSDRQVLIDGVENINEEALTIRGGLKRTISTRKSRFIDSNGKKFIVGVIRDITERKKYEESLRNSEAQFRGLFIQSHVGSALVGLDKCLIKCNEAFCRFLGYKEKELIGKTIADFTHPEDIKLGMPDMKRIAEGVIESALVHKRYIRKDGAIVWGELTISLVRDENNKPLYFLPVIQDITERKKAEKELKELNATKDKIFSIIAHDLRSPFTTILGFSDLIIQQAKETNNTKSEKFSGYIYSISKNALTLLDNLLNWAKSQTGQINYNPSKLNLSSIIREVVEQEIAIAKTKCISINQKQFDNIDVYTDKIILKIVLRNLISNAIKFTEIGGIITVSAILKEEHIEVSVSDNGVGMNEEQSKIIFDSSLKTSTPGTAKEMGFGLGLILCKEYVNMLDGNIWVESIEGKGSDFIFTLPLNKAELEKMKAFVKL